MANRAELAITCRSPCKRTRSTPIISTTIFARCSNQLHRDDDRCVDEIVGKYGFDKNQPRAAVHGLGIHVVHQIFHHTITEHAAGPHQHGDTLDAYRIADKAQIPDLHGVPPTHLGVVTPHGEVHEPAGEQLRVGEVDETSAMLKLSPIRYLPRATLKS